MEKICKLVETSAWTSNTLRQSGIGSKNRYRSNGATANGKQRRQCYRSDLQQCDQCKRAPGTQPFSCGQPRPEIPGRSFRCQTCFNQRSAVAKNCATNS